MTTVIEHGDREGRHAGWLTLGEAASALGLSVVSVRRRIRAGQLVARQVRTDRGPSWRVRLDHDDQGDRTMITVLDQGDRANDDGGHSDDDRDLDLDHRARPVERGDRDDLVALLAMLRDCEARVDALAADVIARTEAAATWQTRAELLAHQLVEARETIRALEAPKPELAPDPSPELIPLTRNAGPWWRRWWPALAGVALALIAVVAILVTLQFVAVVGTLAIAATLAPAAW